MGFDPLSTGLIGAEVSAGGSIIQPDPVRDFARRQRMHAFGDNVSPILPKPADGAPCNQCGMCCVIKPCWIGRMVFEVKEGECPALQWSASDASCGLMKNPEKFMPTRVLIKGAGQVRAATKLLIGQGIGCIRGQEMVAKRWNTKQSAAALRTLGLFEDTIGTRFKMS